MIKMSEGTVFERAHWSPTHAKGKFTYVMKLDTRIAGPWMDQDTAAEAKAEVKTPAGIVNLKLFPWQAEMVKHINEYPAEGDRTVWVILNPAGKCGKSTLQTYLQHMNLAMPIPEVSKPEQIGAWCFKFPHRCYTIDLVRGYKGKSEIWRAIEGIKDGLVVEHRYSPQIKRIDRPMVLVFTNEMPNLDWLTRDRWRVYCIDPEMELVPWTEGRNEAINKAFKRARMEEEGAWVDREHKKCKWDEDPIIIGEEQEEKEVRIGPASP